LSGLRGSGAREWPSLALAQHDTAGQFDWLWRIYVWTMVGVFVLVVAAILFAAMIYRRRDARRPPQLTSAPRLEGAYVGVIGLIVIALITVSFRTENQIDPLTGNPALRVNVTAFQWQWRFGYPASGISLVGSNVASRHPTYAQLVVPAGRPVEFSLRSGDVLHAFFIPAVRFKRYAFPNYTNRFELTFPHPGRFLGECSQFCGWDHAEMRFVVIVLPADRFQAWLQAHTGSSSA
jgi:cytochrome c oxidase subunit 2